MSPEGWHTPSEVEFFSARADDIDEALVERGAYGRFPTVEAKGLTEVSLATLGEILGVARTTTSLTGSPKVHRPKAERPVSLRFPAPSGTRSRAHPIWIPLPNGGRRARKWLLIGGARKTSSTSFVS